MGLITSWDVSPSSIATIAAVLPISALCFRIFQNLYLSPQAKFSGPWYAASFSLAEALISWYRLEPEWLLAQVKKYGWDKPVRISPNILLFAKNTFMKDIYWDPKCNTKGGTYSTGMLGPPHLFSTLDGEEHRDLRKALSNAPWTIGPLKNAWESRFDDQVNLFVEKMTKRAKSGETVCISDKVAEFAADIMTMVSFTTPFGFVKNDRDEKLILTNWRQGLDIYGFVGRCRFFRVYIMRIPVLATWLLPRPSNTHGNGWLMCEADRQVTVREKLIEQGEFKGKPDFLQHCLEARMDGRPLSPAQKRAHVTLLIQAGADTTGTALGSVLRELMKNPETLERARREIEKADKEGNLSNPIQFEETRVHLPYFVACIKEGIRLFPPAPNNFVRVVPKEGKVIDGMFVPAGTEITTNAYIVHRDPNMYAPDPETFRPERWLESKGRANEFDAASFAFGMGPRVCLGKDIAIMELYKLLPEFIRKFDLELIDEGKYVVAGGVSYNQNLLAKPKLRA